MVVELGGGKDAPVTRLTGALNDLSSPSGALLAPHLCQLSLNFLLSPSIPSLTFTGSSSANFGGNSSNTPRIAILLRFPRIRIGNELCEDLIERDPSGFLSECGMPPRSYQGRLNPYLLPRRTTALNCVGSELATHHLPKLLDNRIIPKLSTFGVECIERWPNSTWGIFLFESHHAWRRPRSISHQRYTIAGSHFHLIAGSEA